MARRLHFPTTYSLRPRDAPHACRRPSPCLHTVLEKTRRDDYAQFLVESFDLCRRIAGNQSNDKHDRLTFYERSASARLAEVCSGSA